MDDDKHIRSYHLARTAALIAGSLATFIAFAIFQISGLDIVETAAWMFALGAMTFSGTFVVAYIARSMSAKRTGVAARA